MRVMTLSGSSDRLILMQSAFEPKPVLVTTDPAHGQLEFLTRRLPELPNAVPVGHEHAVAQGQIPPGPWDPALFKDDDGRCYLYWDSSETFPFTESKSI